MIAPPEFAPEMAVFLDFDGTLVDIVDTPEAVEPAGTLTGLLGDCLSKLGGALAVVSGRPIRELDRFLSPLRLPAAGLHGLEYRLRLDAPIVSAETGTEIGVLRERLKNSALLREGIFVEDKGAALAVHYRAAPEAGRSVLATMEEFVRDLDTLHLVAGKMVVEAKPDHWDKGRIVETFMERAPFRGRMPVFVGDDVTDEDGIRAAAMLGGHGIKVGEGKSGAAFRLADVAAVHNWLAGEPANLRIEV